jgi:glycosyltransferase involved in cell wall biosynthesis
MKIILATPIYPPEIGGPATYVKEICEKLHQQHDITVVAFTDVKEPFQGTQLVSVSKRRPLPIRLIKFFLAVWKTSKEAELIYVQNAMAAGLPVALVSVIRKKPFILKFVGDEAWERANQHKRTTKRLEEFLREPDGGLKTKLMMLVQGFVLRRASLVTTPSAYLRDEIIKAYKINPENTAVNYNAAEKPHLLPFETKRKQYQIATTARLVKHKGIEGIIEALSLVKNKFPETTLVVAGDGPEMENLTKLTKQLNLEDSVTFLGNISRAETWQLRKNSDVYVLNSTYEGLPHTILSSFAAEIPTIATNISGTNEAVYHEKTGLLVEPGDVEELARSIERLFIDKILTQKLIEGGLKILKEKFSWETHLKNLNLFMQSVLSKPVNKV